MIPSLAMSDHVALEIKVQEYTNKIKWLLLGIAGIGILGGGYLLLERQSEKQQNDAFAAFYVAEKIEEDAMKAEVESTKETATEKDSAKKTVPNSAKTPKDSFYEIAKSWDESKLKPYLEALEKTETQYPKSMAATLAHLRHGNLFVHLGQMDNAEKHFKKVASDFKPKNEESAIFLAIAYEALGSIYEQQKKWDLALGNFQSAEKVSQTPLKPLALLGMARVYQAQGKVEDSHKIFDRVISEFPNSDFEKRARALKFLPSQG